MNPSTELARSPETVVMAADVEKVLIGGDLGKLTPEQRISYYNAVCRSLNLNPLTKPFAYLNLSGKTVLYAQKDCTEQLRNNHSISLSIPSREVIEGIYVVTASASRPDGRHDESTGAVPIENLKGEAKANAMMKAETKAKRRVTLSICGLGMLDESEVDSIAGSERIEPDHQEGSQAAADHVRDQKLAAAKSSGDPELEAILASCKNPATFKSATSALDGRILAASGPEAADQVWRECVEQFGDDADSKRAMWPKWIAFHLQMVRTAEKTKEETLA